MAQVSGSISLEMSKVVRETTRAVLDALLTRQAPDGEVTPLEEITMAVSGRLERELGGVLAEVRTALVRLEELVRAESQRRDRMAGPRPLDWDNLVATLSHHLPAGTSHPSVGDEFKVAAFQAAHLAEAGYAIVPVSGEALAGLAATQETEVVRGPVREPDHLGTGGITPEASARADARLAEARRNGVDDSWYEEDSA